MRGRWASAAIGASIARNRAGAKMDEQAESYQREIDQLKAAQAQPSQVQQSSGQEDITQKLKKLADLKQQGILTEEEFQKLKTDLLAKF
ncbi:MAG: SHOCT domain-containing protein [Nitrososphaeraceae archaeon]